MNKHQIIKTEAGEELVVLSRRDYDAMRARAGEEDAENTMTARILKEAKAASAVAIPVSLWEAIEAAASPIGPLRQWRKLNQHDLAGKAGISQGYLSELETGKKIGDLATLRAIAAALGVGLDDVAKD